MSKKKKKMKLTKWHAHEALDRVHVVQNIIEDNLSRHPWIAESETLTKKINKAQDFLSQVYHDINFDQFAMSLKKDKKGKI